MTRTLFLLFFGVLLGNYGRSFAFAKLTPDQEVPVTESSGKAAVCWISGTEQSHSQDPSQQSERFQKTLKSEPRKSRPMKARSAERAQ